MNLEIKKLRNNQTPESVQALGELTDKLPKAGKHFKVHFQPSVTHNLGIIFHVSKSLIFPKLQYILSRYIFQLPDVMTPHDRHFCQVIFMPGKASGNVYFKRLSCCYNDKFNGKDY